MGQIKPTKAYEARSLIETESFYNRIADFYSLTFKVNGYGKSVEQYLKEKTIPVYRHTRILDAGCGTGLLTLALQKSLRTPVQIVAMDLSMSSVKKTRHYARKNPNSDRVQFAQANLLSMPFSDDAFDVVVTSGVLEYVSLEKGLAEISRILVPGGYFLHLPMRPSLMGKILEKLYFFQAHSPTEILSQTKRYFDLMDIHHFPKHHPISWTRTAILARKPE